MMARAIHTPAFRSDAARFQAVLLRDRRADARFVYAVQTTGVFCRASCASRRPLRKNVRFFDTPAQAIAAGYRACLRCRPLERAAPATRVLRRACRLLEGETRRESREVAQTLGLSQAYFQRWFKHELGVTPQAYARRVRAERAKEALNGSRSVLEASLGSGYSAPSRFYADAAAELGMKASAARSGGADQTVRYATCASWIGQLLVAWTARGVCHVALGDTDADTTAELTERFPHAERVKERVPAWVREIEEAVGSPRALNMPLDIQGTVFQERVWALVRAIPAGERRSYAQLARALSAPRSSRAVARACAQNPLALLVPCHRVVRSDGGLAGYRWGLSRKRALLRCEGALSQELRGESGV